MSKEKIDYSQFPDASIPVYYSLPKGFLTYTGQIIPKHLKRKVYLLSPERASKVLDLIPYQAYLDGDITKQDAFIHKEYGKKINFTKLNRAILTLLRTEDEKNLPKLYLKLLSHFPFTYTAKPKVKRVKIETPTIDHRFDLDFDDPIPNSQPTLEIDHRFDLDFT